ncbi:hypothetical protein ACEQ8H_004189 [Pleosporales sp. CAS-2024a]
MAESTLSRLNYGHAGTCAFDIESQKWHFARNFAVQKLKQIGIRDRRSIETIPAAVQSSPTAFSTRTTDAKHSANDLVHDHPQLALAKDLLPSLAVTSAAIASTASTYDPLVGALFSTGSITYVDNRAGAWDNPRRIAAMVSGEAGNILRLSIFHQEDLGWGSDKTVWIRGDTLRGTEAGYWNEDAAPIQQVCFSQSEDRSTLLAVRLLTKTVIFRPFYSSRPQPAMRSRYYDLPHSLIDAHPILSLCAERTGGSPHVDVSFNPDFQLQFAVVDQNHVWSVWDIDHKRRGSEYELSCMVQGPITTAEDALAAGEDGWARIMWTGDVSTILVCNRRTLSVIAIAGGSFTYLPCTPVVSPRTSDWILDVKRHPVLRSCFFVLTSSELCLMAMTTPNEAVDATVGPEGARLLLSWVHYRGTEDFTLHMTISMLNANNLCVLLHSRLNNLTQVFVVPDASSRSTALVSSTDPTALDLEVGGAGHILKLTLEPCRYHGDTSRGHNSATSYLADGVAFYKLFVLRSDLSVHETIVYATASVAAKVGANEAVENLLWTRTCRPKKRLRTIGDVQEMDDFIELDGIEAMKAPTSKLLAQAPRSCEDQGWDTAQRAVDHRPLYDALLQNRDEGFDIATLATRLQQVYCDMSESSPHAHATLLELTKGRLEIPDVDEVSALLQQLLDSEAEQLGVDIRRIGSTNLLQLGEGEQPTMSALYDAVLQNWVASLPPQVHKRIRQRKERLARRIAAEVTLASARAFSPEASISTSEIQPGLNPASGITVPMLPSQPLAGSDQNCVSSPPLPLPVASYHSQATISSSEPMSSRQPPLFTMSNLADPLAGLRKHLYVKGDGSTQGAIPEGVSRLLSQWQPGVDPCMYDWDAAERATRVETLEEIDEQEAEKSRRRRERRKIKQEGEDKMANESQTSSQPFVQTSTIPRPTAFSRSSPGPTRDAYNQQVPLPGTVSQVQVPSSFPVQSQVEPGKFGGRPETKKKKKGRVGGF